MIVFRKKIYDLVFISIPLIILTLLSYTLNISYCSVILFFSTILLTLFGILFRRHKKISKLFVLLYFFFFPYYSFSLAFMSPICHTTIGVFIPLIGSFFHYMLLSNMYHYIKRNKIASKYAYSIKLIPVIVIYAIYLFVMFMLSSQAISEIPTLFMFSISLITFIIFLCNKSISILWKFSYYWTYVNFCFAVVLSFFIIAWPNPNFGFVLCSFLMSYSILSARIIKDIAKEKCCHEHIVQKKIW